jgi:squalene-hopene/tetraprenyl-beta-curcumene cyclase
MKLLVLTMAAGGLAVAVAGQNPAPAGDAKPIALTAYSVSSAGVSESLRREGQAALDRAAGWLKAQQQADGHWSNAEHPALTALPVWALSVSGHRGEDTVKKGVAFLLGCAQDNGGIYVEPKQKIKGGGLGNYNTALAMVGLHMSGDPKAVPVVLKAREFVAKSQHLGGDVYYGGMGYDADSGRAYADLSNSYIAYEAMRLTQSVEDSRKDTGKKVDLDWKAAQEFLQKVQNDPSVNKQSWASDDPKERGGFAYTPEQTRAGTTTNAQGVVKFRSMKGMTYAGMLSYIYAEVDRSDPRVEATVNWIVNNWSTDSNNRPSGGSESFDTKDEKEGLFYLLNVMSKGLAAYGKDKLQPPGKPAIEWRQQMIEKLLSLQKTDPATGHGYWVNEVGRYWESDPVLVTSYAMIALRVALGQ